MSTKTLINNFLIYSDKCICGASKILLMEGCVRCGENYKKDFCSRCNKYAVSYGDGFVCSQCYAYSNLSLDEYKKIKTQKTNELRILYQKCLLAENLREFNHGNSKRHKLWFIKTFMRKRDKRKVILTLEELEDKYEYEKNRGYIRIMLADNLYEERVFGVDPRLKKIKLNEKDPQKTINWCVSRVKKKLGVF